MQGVRIERAGIERLDEFEPLWKALHEHHTAVAPTVCGLRARGVDEAWARRRAAYDQWLRERGAFALVAERDEQAIGYAIVRSRKAIAGYSSGERVGVLESLAVLGEARTQGVGAALLEAVDRELTQQGVTELIVGVLPQNERALRFYERRGFSPYLTYFLAPTSATPRPQV